MLLCLAFEGGVKFAIRSSRHLHITLENRSIKRNNSLFRKDLRNFQDSFETTAIPAENRRRLVKESAFSSV